MNPEITKIIDQYLQGELSETDKIAFEKKYNENEILRAEVEFQKQIYDAAKRGAIKNEVKQISKKYHFVRKLAFSSVIIAVVSALALSIWYFNEKQNSDEKVKQQFEKLESRLSEKSPIENLNSEFFNWKGNNLTILSKNGVLLSITEDAFLIDGKKYKGDAIIQWQEALDAATIVKSGLSTVSGDKLLETQGMFSIQAFTPEGKKLEINPKTGIYVQIPVDEYKKDMKLFEGQKNADGIIDWQNPKPLLKIPVSVDMEKLDFYPEGYEKKLDQLKLRKDKKYRDSLYLSLEEAGFSGIAYEYEDINADTIERRDNYSSASELFYTKCSTCHQPHKDGTGPKLFEVRKKWAEGGAKEGSIIKWVQNWENTARIDPYASELTRVRQTAMRKFPELSEGQIIRIFDFIDGQTLSQGIPPSKVLGFWNPTFNNTNLATREFEKRMQAIHQTCNEKILDLYVQNLSKPISEIDQQILKMGYPEFETFAAEQLGAVNPNNPHLKNLQKFYGKAISEMRTELQNNRKILAQKQQKWDDEIFAERIKASTREFKRSSESLNEEYNYNLKNVYRQLGKTIGVQVYGTSNIYNIDKYVMDATVSRKTTTFVDPITKKTAIITYNNFSLEVENLEKYKQLYVYAFPHNFNSYQRLTGKNGKFEYPLNDDLRYDIAVVGISDEGFSYFQFKNINEGNKGKIKLKEISETKLNASIEQLNQSRSWKPMDIKDELDWLILENKNYKEQKLRQQQAKFRQDMKAIIFPCYGEKEFPGDPEDEGIIIKM